jgi:SAM-dependent methyltransferase
MATNYLGQKFERLLYIFMGQDKEFAEIKFWRRQISQYVSWYNGELKELYGHPTPTNEQKIKAATPELSALLTFFYTHQTVKYQSDLRLQKDDLIGMKVLDIGSGPFPSALVFNNCETYSLDPLMDSYIAAGYPLHCYEQRNRFVKSMAESMPFEDGFFDAVISANAIDHVNDFAAVAKEIQRVLKPNGKFRMHVHYHPKTKAEPLELNDEIFLENYSWVKGLKKIHTSKEKIGTTINSGNESFTVWGN